MKKYNIQKNVLLTIFFILIIITNAVSSVPDGIYYIKTAKGKYLAIEGAIVNNRAALVQWDFSAGDNHKFEVKNQTDGTVLIKAVHSGRYLNVEWNSAENNARIIQWDYVNQANFKFLLIGNMGDEGLSGSHAVQCNNAGMFWNVHGGNDITENGRAIVQYKNAMQWFFFEDANKKPGDVGGIKIQKVPSHLSTSYKRTRNTGDNVLTSTYDLNESAVIKAEKMKNKEYGKSVKKVVSEAEGDNINCQAENVRISLDDNSFMTADIGSQLGEIVPGVSFNFEDYLNGSWKAQPEPCNPITLTSSVKNIKPNGRVYQEVTNPQRHTLNQAVANLYTDFGEQQQTSMTYNCIIKEVQNKGEFQLQIGAGAHYMGFSLENLFNFQKSKTSNHLFLDITKIMFTIKADASNNGFFANTAVDQKGKVYIKTVDYGLRILVSIETVESIETIGNRLNAAGNWGVAGFNVSLDILDKTFVGEKTIKMFIVGGNSRDVVPVYSIADLKNKVERLVGGLTYQTSQPIKYQLATTAQNYVVDYYSATDVFKKQTCQPEQVVENKTVNVKVENFIIVANQDFDSDLYGKVWVMAYKGPNNPVPAQYGNNHLMNINGENGNELDLNSENMQYTANSTVIFNGLNQSDAGTGAYVEVFFAFFDRDGCCPDWGYGDDADDEQFIFQSTNAFKSCENGAFSNRWCRMTVPLGDMKQPTTIPISEVLTVDGDYLTVKFNLSTIVLN